MCVWWLFIVAVEQVIAYIVLDMAHIIFIFHLFSAGECQLIHCSLMLPSPVHSYYVSRSERGAHRLMSASSHRPPFNIYPIRSAHKTDVRTCSSLKDSCWSQETYMFCVCLIAAANSMYWSTWNPHRCSGYVQYIYIQSTVADQWLCKYAFLTDSV